MIVPVLYTIKSYDKMQAGLHAFPTGQYEYDGFLLTLYLFAKILAECRTSQNPLLSNL